ncbi:phosphopentomutase [bacterium]|nr:phosphopentomutase [bacterium]
MFVIILDGLGVGDLPDSRAFGDEGRNTLANLAAAVGGLALPTLAGLGLGRVQAWHGLDLDRPVQGGFARLAAKSPGKDSTTGHWELMGLVLDRPFPLFPQGFPVPLLEELTQRTGFGFIGNVAASGTEIIERLGDEHRETGKLIVYTSADSVFQVAAHEERLPVTGLYAFCAEARALLQGEFGVSRVIARPFTGRSGNYRRSAGRRDFSLPPPGETLLDRLLAAGLPVIGIGKVRDLFAGRGFSTHVPSKGNEECMASLREVQARSARAGLVLANLIDFDMLWGHRRDPAGYAEGLRVFDRWLAGFLADMGPRDWLFITADHGNDPTGPGSDHTREYVPLLARGPEVREARDLGRRESFADLAATLAEAFALPVTGAGRSLWAALREAPQSAASEEERHG